MTNIHQLHQSDEVRERLERLAEENAAPPSQTPKQGFWQALKGSLFGRAAPKPPKPPFVRHAVAFGNRGRMRRYLGRHERV